MTVSTTNWKYRMPLLGAIILMATTAWAQGIEWSAKYPMNSIFNKNEFIQASRDGFYVLQNYKDANYYYQQNISFYTLKFEKREGAKPIKFGEGKSKGNYQFAFSKGSLPYLAYSVDEMARQKETLFINPVESSSLGLGGAPIKIFEIDYKDKIKPKGGYRYCASPDGSRFLFYGQMPYEKKAKGGFYLHLVDAKLEALGEGVVFLKQAANILTVSDVVDAVIDDNGLVYLLCKMYKGKDKKEEKKIGKRFVYSLIQMDYKAKTKVQILDTLKVLFPKDSAVVVSAKLSVNRTSGMVRCIGTYKLPNQKAGLFTLNAQQAFVEMPVVMDYPAEILDFEAKIPRKIKQQQRLSLSNYKIKSIFEQADGTQIVVAEQHYINVYWDKSEGRQEQHQLNNILVAKIRDQKIVWSKVLAKRQKAGAEGYTNVPGKLYSFYAFLKDGNIHLLYNEMKANLELTDEFQLQKGYYNKPKDCYLVHCTIDLNSGILKTKESILGLKEAGIAVYPQETKVLEDGSVLFGGVKPEYSLKQPSYIRFGRWVLD